MTKSSDMEDETITRLSEDSSATKPRAATRKGKPLAAASAKAFASIRYKDRHGRRHDYLMRKEKISIGKGHEADGAAGRGVDLALDFDADISRLHLQLFFDATSRKFFVKDLSARGTRVNGRLVKSSVGKKGGRRIDLDVLEELPDASRIGLSDKIILDFKSLMTD